MNISSINFNLTAYMYPVSALPIPFSYISDITISRVLGIHLETIKSGIPDASWTNLFLRHSIHLIAVVQRSSKAKGEVENIKDYGTMIRNCRFNRTLISEKLANNYNMK